jgi:hypothetical protein
MSKRRGAHCSPFLHAARYLKISIAARRIALQLATASTVTEQCLVVIIDE